MDVGALKKGLKLPPDCSVLHPSDSPLVRPVYLAILYVFCRRVTALETFSLLTFHCCQLLTSLFFNVVIIFKCKCARHLFCSLPSLSLSTLPSLSVSLFIVHYEQRKKYAKYAIYIYVRFRQLYSPSLYLSVSFPLCLAALL